MRIYLSLNKTQDKSDKSDSLRMPLVIVPNTLRLARSSTLMTDFKERLAKAKDKLNDKIWLMNVSWMAELYEYDDLDQLTECSLLRLEQFMIDNKEDFLSCDSGPHVVGDIINVLYWALKTRKKDVSIPHDDSIFNIDIEPTCLSELSDEEYDALTSKSKIPSPPLQPHDGCKFCNLE